MAIKEVASCQVDIVEPSFLVVKASFLVVVRASYPFIMEAFVQATSLPFLVTFTWAIIAAYTSFDPRVHHLAEPQEAYQLLVAYLHQKAFGDCTEAFTLLFVNQFHLMDQSGLCGLCNY